MTSKFNQLQTNGPQASKRFELIDPPTLSKNPCKQRSPHESILTTIGETPIVQIYKDRFPNVDLYAKCEFFNPLGSVKDRLALGILEYATHYNLIEPGQTVIEATSGNSGIGMAMVCAVKKHPFVAVMPETCSIERRQVMRFLGAKVILLPKGPNCTLSEVNRKAKELAEKNGWFLAEQFSTKANAWVHRETTGKEIARCFSELDYLVTGYGTGGTFQGVAEVLREELPNCKVVLCEPDEAQLVKSGVKTEYDAKGFFQKEHESWSPHKIQGWTPDFIPKIVQDGVDKNFVDELMQVSGEDAIKESREIAKNEGLFCGISGGGTLSCALKLAESISKERILKGERKLLSVGDADDVSSLTCSGKKVFIDQAGHLSGTTSILVMLTDTAERYLSTGLFEGLVTPGESGMTQEEDEIYKSVCQSSSTKEDEDDATTVPASTFASFQSEPESEHEKFLCELSWEA